MTIKLLKFIGEKRVVNKTLSSYKDLIGDFRYPVDIKNPVIDIQYSFENASNNFDIKFYNYVYIQNLNRIYLIVNFEYISNKIARLYLHIDTLATFYSSYNSLSAYVYRTANSSKANFLLPDEFQPFQANKSINYVVPSTTSGVTLDTFNINQNVSTSYCILLSVLTNRDAGSGLYGIHSTDQIGTISAATAGSSFSTEYYFCKWSDINTFIANMYNDDQKVGYVKRIVAFPFDLYDKRNFTLLPLSKIYIGNTSVSVGNVYLTIEGGVRLKIADFTYNVSNNYHNYNNYAQYYIWLPYYGYKEINAEDLIGKRICVYITVNFENGVSTLIVQNYTDNKTLFSTKLALGVNVGASSSNTLEYEKARDFAEIGMATSTIMGVASIGIGAVATTVNPLIGVGMIAGGVGSILNSATNGMSKYEQTYHQGNAQVSTSVNGLELQQTVHLKIIKAIPAISQSSYSNEYGYPCAFKNSIYSCLGDGMTLIKEILLPKEMTTKNTNYSFMNNSSNNIITDGEYQELEQVIKEGIIL